MKTFIVCIALFLVPNAALYAQDIEAKLSGNTTTQGFTVKNYAGTPLFTVRGDGKIGLGILNPDALLHVAGQVKITGGSPGAGKVLTSDAIGLATWTMLSSLPPSGPAGGDLNGTYPNPTITDNAVTSVKIANSAVTAVKIGGTGATSGQVLQYNGSSVAWATPASGGGTLDQAYDQGGAGAGRTITADAGAVVISGVDGLLVTGESTTQGTIPASGAGARMMWYPKKRAFRVGSAIGTEWDDANIGLYSTAMGSNTTASGLYSTAMGRETTADDSYCTAMGWGTTASEDYSTAMGYNTTASGHSSTAMGANTTASGDQSTAMGINTLASGAHSTAMGSYASTGGYAGSMAIGDNSTNNVLTNTAANQWVTRFAGGIRFYTNAITTTGVYMNAGTSGWTNYCDRNKKENFTIIDGETLLLRLRAVPVSEWNYKDSDASVRYIGPMAQDFWQAFHLGGTDSLGINSVSIDGVNMAAIQALEKRTTELRQKTDEIALLKEELTELKTALKVYESQAAEIRQLRNDLTILKALLTGTSTSGSVKHASFDPAR